MDTIKTIIYSACIIGIISTMIEIASPEGTMKKQIDIIIGIVLILVVITPFMDSNFKFRLSDFTSSYDKQIYNDIKSYENSFILENAERKISAYIEQKLNRNTINCKDVVITMNINEYNQIEITKVKVIAQKEYKSRITELIKADLPQTEVTVVEGDSS